MSDIRRGLLHRRFPQLLVMRVARAGWWRYLLISALGLIIQGLSVAAAIVSSLIFTELLTGGSAEQIWALIGWLVLLLVLSPLFVIAKGIASSRVMGVLKHNLRQLLLRRIYRLGPLRLGKYTGGKLQAILVDGIESTQDYFGAYLPHLLVVLANGIFITIWIGQYSWLIAIVLLLLAIIAVVLPRIWDKALAEKGDDHWRSYEELNAEFVDSMMGMTTLKSFNASGWRGEELHRKSQQLLRNTMSKLKVSLGESGLNALIVTGGPAAVLILAVTQIAQGQLSLTALFVVVLLAREMFKPLRELANLWHSGYLGISVCRELCEFMSVSADAKQGAGAEQAAVQGSDLAPAGTSALSLHRVCYQYSGADVPTLTDVSVAFPAGKTTAIIGGSGSGKSTLLGLMLGLDRADSGTIARGLGSDGNSLKMSLVPQSPIIFGGTVRQALKDADPDASDQQLLQLLAIAQLDDLRTDGLLDMMLLERGQNLSGGQKQRLAIARALATKPDILILDESTSALDSAVEEKILSQLRERFPDLTLILVTHRMEVARRCDHIVVMSRGCCTAEGSVAAVLAGDTEAAALLSAGQKTANTTKTNNGGRA